MSELPRRPKQQRAVATRARLLEAGRRRFFAQGYMATTSNHIAEEAGVSIGTFYNHFPDKKQVLAEIIQEASAESLAIGALLTEEDGAAATPGADPLEEAVRRLLATAPDFVALQAVWQDAAAAESEFRDALRRFEEESQRHHLAILTRLAPDKEPHELELAAYAVRGMLLHVVKAWAEGKLGEDSERTAREFARFLQLLQALLKD